MAASRAEVDAGHAEAADLPGRSRTSYQRILARELLRDWDAFAAGLNAAASNQGARGYPAYDETSTDLLTTLHHLRARIERSEATRS